MQNSSEQPIATSESTKSFQQLQMLSTMIHPVCIYSVNQSSNFPSSVFFYPNSSDSFVMQNLNFPFQKSSYRGSPPSNYMQLQENTMQFMPGFSNVGNLPQTQLAGQDTGPTGSTSNISPISQQPEKTPYFCGYMSLPILHLPSISDTLQSGRFSVDNVKDSSPKESRKLFQKDGTVISQDDSGK